MLHLLLCRENLAVKQAGIIEEEHFLNQKSQCGVEAVEVIK